MGNSDLKQESIKGFKWSFIDNISKYSISFIVSIILARLLSPEEYGTIGIILIFTTIFSTLVDSGFSTALIRKKDADETDYNTIFTTNIIFSILLCAILIIGAPAVATFFGNEELIPLSRVMSLIIIINALSLIPKTLLTKSINFKTQAKVTATATIVSGVIGITMALLGFKVWSLVGLQIANAAISTVSLWFFSKWHPHLQFSIERFKELFDYSWKLMLIGITHSLWKEMYSVIISKFYNASSLGQFTRAKLFSDAFSSNLTKVVQRVTMPVLSKIQDNPELLKRSYIKVIRTTMFITFAALFGLAAISESMILTLLGDKWGEAAKFLPLICFLQMFYPLNVINLNLIALLGRSDTCLKLEIIGKCLLTPPLIIGIYYNIYSMLIGSIIASFICYLINAHHSGRLINYTIKAQIRDIMPSFLVMTAMALPVYAIHYLNMSPYVTLPVQLIFGAALLLFLCKTFKIKEYNTLRVIILSRKRKNQHE